MEFLRVDHFFGAPLCILMCCLVEALTDLFWNLWVQIKKGKNSTACYDSRYRWSYSWWSHNCQLLSCVGHFQPKMYGPLVSKVIEDWQRHGPHTLLLIGWAIFQSDEGDRHYHNCNGVRKWWSAEQWKSIFFWTPLAKHVESRAISFLKHKINDSISQIVYM